MVRTCFGAYCLVIALGCASTPRTEPSQILFLTRDGCVNTDTMRQRLDEALRALDWPGTYPLINVDTLPAAHVWRGYGTPTIVYRGQDLFGMPAPTVATPVT